MPNLAGVGAAISVQVAFTTTPGAATPTWTTIPNAKVRSVSTRRGRQRVVDKFSAGTCTVVFDNRTRDFDPSYTGSPYYPNVLPMRRIRIVATFAAVSYTLFTGYIDGWQQQYNPPRDATATVTATDAFKLLAGAKVPDLGYKDTVLADTPKGYWRLGDGATSNTATDSSGNGYTGAMHGDFTFGDAGALQGDVDNGVTLTSTSWMDAGTGPGLGLTNGPFTLEAWVKTTTGGANYQYIVAVSAPDSPLMADLGIMDTTGYANFELYDTNGIFWEATSAIKVNDGAWHHLVGTLASNHTSMTLYVDGASRATASYGDPYSFSSTTRLVVGAAPVFPAIMPVPNFDGSVDEVAVYTTALSSARVLAHYQTGSAAFTDGDTTGARIIRMLDHIGYPSGAARNIDTGNSTVQRATDTIVTDTVLTNAQNIEATENGRLFIDGAGVVTFQARQRQLVSPGNTSLVTFGDAAGEQHYSDVTLSYDDQLIRNDVRMGAAGLTTQVATDATSITSYLRSTHEPSGLQTTTENELFDAANWILSHFKDPQLRITDLTVQPRRDPTNLFPWVLSLEIGNVITVNRRPQGLGAAISQALTIEGVRHDFDANSRWKTSFSLSPADTQTYWVVGGNFLDTDTRLAY